MLIYRAIARNYPAIFSYSHIELVDEKGMETWFKIKG
jgi:hypothetical protein